MVEATLREGRRVGGGLRTARLTHMKTLESNDFSIQPSLDRHRVMALAQLEFINRAEVVTNRIPRQFHRCALKVVTPSTGKAWQRF